MKEYIKDIENALNKHSYDEDYIKRIKLILQNVMKYIKDKEIKLIYPQNVFLDRQDAKFYIFLEDFIVIASHNEYNSVMEVLRIKDIEKIENVEDNETGNLILKMHFHNGQIVVLNNNMDAKKEHIMYLRDLIEKVIDLVLQYKR